MQLESIELKGLTVFKDTQTVDFTQLPEGLIAIVGRNGQGKTTFMESIYAALYRDLPTRPGIMKFVNGRDARIHLRFRLNGMVLESRLLLDGDRSKQEAFLLEDGEPVDGSNGKVRTFDDAVASRVGTRGLMLSSVFSAQNRSGNFLEMRVGDRKNLFVELLGLGHIPETEKRAKERVEIELSRIRQLQESITKVEAEEKDLETAKQKHIECDRLLETAKANLATAIVEKDAIVKEEADLTAKASEAVAQVKADRTALDNHRSTAAADLRELNRSIEERRQKLQADTQTAQCAISELQTTIAGINTKIENNRNVLAKRDRILKAVADIPVVEKTIATLEQECERLRELSQARLSKREAYRSEDRELQILDKEIEAAERNSDEVNAVPCHAAAPYDTCPKIIRAVEEGKKIPDLKEKHAVRQRALETIQEELDAMPADPDGERRIKTDALGEARERLKELQSDAKFEVGLRNAEERVPELTGQLTDATQRLTEYQKPAAEDEVLASLSAQQRSLEGRFEEIKIAAEEIERRQTETVIPLQSQAAQAYERREEAIAKERVQRGYVSDFEVQLQVAANEVQRLSGSEAKKVRLQDELKEAEASHSDWTRIAKAYGKNGIPALEIDAAGPALSELINELVSSCFSSRFYFKLRTQREKADGDLAEDFDVEVTDNVEGWTGTIDDLSGGQKVIAAEAIGLAIALYNKADHPLQTLFRDESAGALDVETAPLYVEMLKKAMKIGGFRQTFFITHSPDCAEMADAVLLCKDGKINVERL